MKRRSSGVVVPHSARWYQRLLAWAVVALVRAVSLTIRFKLNDRSEYFDKARGPAIYCFWHSRLALCVTLYKRFGTALNPTLGVAALVSASRDGAFLSAILQGFGVHAVRGSSSRRGPQALLELTSWADRGYDLAITPDGPRGPCYVVQEGVMSLAQLTGRPIIPFSYNLSWRIRLGSWDRFQIPLPFARCEIQVEKPVHVPREATDAERETMREELERRLRSITPDS